MTPTRPLILALGEILWDLLPAGKQLGGAPANFAYHAAQLGADAKIVSAVGDDDLGHEVLQRLRALRLDTTYIATDPDHPTGTVSVSLDSSGIPTYTIHQKVTWDFIPTTHALRAIAARADCVCFGSLAQRSPVSRDTIRDLVSRTPPQTLRIFDINLRQHYYDRDIIEHSLALANVLKINDTEIRELSGIFGCQIDNLLDKLFVRDHLDLIALTRGAGGSILYAKDGTKVEHPGYPATPLIDTVGAGDAFTAALAMGLLRQLPLEQINDRANRLASYICTQPGATPSIPGELLQQLDKPRA
jgi:fructokinase